MGFLGDISFGLLGDTSAEEAAQASAAAMGQVNPFDVTTSLGSLKTGNGSVATTLDPRLQKIQGGLLSRLSGLDPGSMLKILRKQARPFEEQQGLNLENRLFKQGILGHSAVDQPGGARRSLFDAIQNAELQRQLAAFGESRMQRQSLFGGLGAISGIESGLFNPSLGFGGFDMAKVTGQHQPLMEAANQRTSGLQGLATTAIGGINWGGGGSSFPAYAGQSSPWQPGGQGGMIYDFGRY